MIATLLYIIYKIGGHFCCLAVNDLGIENIHGGKKISLF